ncbi:MAG TPA: aminotransferase class I/II-fold pyridoxal phosphate-dependent enzyme [Thermoclostridium sp.]|nr:aminotransferase class I/II-fold pyridoxal phosphate-dependent enzyme [Clostridiaceae bacterium]HOJ85228.1 aminotransferase class I/II-fold pyridoxal phosphate-dependent enzyme [Bacillota bacterium]HOQ76129.1 aminotransferase class I/II-fold pyridoxal phosphate-dependent enzyme [Thermoclostridium sp.]
MEEVIEMPSGGQPDIDVRRAYEQKIAPWSLPERKEYLLRQYEEYKKQGLKLDMSRGKPGSDQLNLSMDLFKNAENLISESGIDCRNYGAMDGIIEAKRFFASVFNLSEDQIIVGGNSSLNLMYDLISKALLLGLNGFSQPWGKQGKLKFLCPSPGYDRHFAITQQFGFEMITIPMTQEGPDMDMVEELVSRDPSIKGMWSIPMYSNPTGITFSDRAVRRLAAMETAADDFIIMWDNAYPFHHLYDTEDTLLDLIGECKKAGHPHRTYMFSSTSKVTFPGAGIAMVASSPENIAALKKQIAIQTIGFDKINQLLHVRFLKDPENLKKHMRKHAEFLRPKFETVIRILEKNLEGKGIASWHKPRGGYFISLNVMKGCARRVVELAKEAGVTLTPAGATFPYGKDPYDANIRLAPTYPPLEELEKAIEILCVCVELAALERLQ